MTIEASKDWMIQEPEDQRKQEQNVKRPLKRKGPSSLPEKGEKWVSQKRMDVAAEVAKEKLAAIQSDQPQPMDVAAPQEARKPLLFRKPKRQYAPKAKKVALTAQPIFHGVAPTLEEVHQKLNEPQEAALIEARKAAIILELEQSDDPHYKEIADHLSKGSSLEGLIVWDQWLASVAANQNSITERDIADIFNLSALDKQVQAFCKLLEKNTNVAFQEIARRFETANAANKMLLPKEQKHAREILKTVYDQAKKEKIIKVDQWLAKADPKSLTEEHVAAFLHSIASEGQVQTFCTFLGQSNNIAFQEVALRFKRAYNPDEELLLGSGQHAREVLQTVYNEVKNETVQDQDIQSNDVIATLRKAVIYLSFQDRKNEGAALINRLIGKNTFFAPLQKDTTKEPLAKMQAMYRPMASLDTLLQELGSKVGGITIGDVERFLHRERLFKYPGDSYTFARLQGLIASSHHRELIPLQSCRTHVELETSLQAAREAGYAEVAKLIQAERISKETLREILKIGPSDEQVKTILSKVETNIADRYRPLKHATESGFEKEPLPARDLLAIALYVEDHITGAQKVDHVFRQQETGLSRTLQLSAQGPLFVIAGEKSRLQGGGGFKKISSAVGIALENYKDTMKAARSYTRTNDIDPATLRETRDEMKLALELGKSGQGFVPCHTFCEYTFREGRIPRFSMIAEAYDGDLQNKRQALSLTDKIQVAKDVIFGVTRMHNPQIPSLKNQPLMHGDLKWENVLWRLQAEGIRAAIIDFGFSRPVKKKRGANGVETDEFETPNCGKYSDGYYGSIIFTSPELYGVPNFTGDPRKAESFAAGYLLWELFYGPPPWHVVIEQSYDKNRAPTDVERNTVVRSIEKCRRSRVTRALNNREFKDLTTDEERLKWCMLKLLDPNPQTRISVVDVEQQLRAIPPQR